MGRKEPLAQRELRADRDRAHARSILAERLGITSAMLPELPQQTVELLVGLIEARNTRGGMTSPDRARGASRTPRDASASTGERDMEGRERDRAARKRDLAAELRDREAEARDDAAGELDRTVSDRPAHRPQGAADAGARAASGRAEAADDRAQAINDRRVAAEDRAQGDQDRTVAANDRARAVSARKSEQQRAHASELSYHRLFAGNPQPMWVYDAATFAFLDVNDAAIAHYGYSRDEFLAMTVQDISPPDDTPALVASEPRSQDLGDAGPRRHLTKDGREILVQISSHEVPFGTAGARHVMAEDVTERVALAEELRRSVDELSRSNRALEEFAYVASHDLQEPLRTVGGYVQLLSRRYKGRLDSDADEFITFAVDGTSRMQVLIEDLLSYSRVQTGGESFQLVDMDKVMEEVLFNLQAAATMSGAQVTNDTLPAIQAAPTQMKQLLQNLIGNAIKFRGAEPPRIEVAVQRQGREWRFAVRDNGIGIPENQSTRIFGLFQRLHSREEYPGTGIGLALCRVIVERHGGKIWVESSPDKGTAFYFTIPGNTPGAVRWRET